MEKHKIRLRHEKNYDGNHYTAFECTQHINGVKSHVWFDPHGLDDVIMLADGSEEFRQLGEILVDAEVPLNVNLRYTFENSRVVHDLHMHKGGRHWSAMVGPEEITGRLILIY